jgi:AmmeMemoRadiSam system protein A
MGAMTSPIDTAGTLPEPVSLPGDLRRCLLGLARTAVAVAARALPPAALERALACVGRTDRRAAAFVTLSEGNDLRGCMGMLDASRPVGESVVEAAACATRTDPRFPPVTPAELAALEVEVSVLGPLARIDDPLSFRVGIDGIVVERNGRRGLLLPEVAPMVDNDRLSQGRPTSRLMARAGNRRVRVPDRSLRWAGAAGRRDGCRRGERTMTRA